MTPPYSAALLQFDERSTVRREPRRMVPPICVRETSGMKTISGCGVASSNSAECASARPSTDRANSMTPTWKPRQMPRYGLRFSRAYLAAAHLPSTARMPKPPGTRTPSALRSVSHAAA